MHQSIALSQPESISEKSFTVTFEPVNCGHPDCSLDFADVEILKESQLFILGESSFHPDVISTNQKRAK